MPIDSLCSRRSRNYKTMQHFAARRAIESCCLARLCTLGPGPSQSRQPGRTLPQALSCPLARSSSVLSTRMLCGVKQHSLLLVRLQLSLRLAQLVHGINRCSAGRIKQFNITKSSPSTQHRQVKLIECSLSTSTDFHHSTSSQQTDMCMSPHISQEPNVGCILWS